MMSMIVEDPNVAKFEIVLISDDVEHARLVLEDLDTSRFAFRVTQVSDRQFIGQALDRLVAAPPRHAPAIVMLDFAFLGADCESLAAHVAELRASTAVECIVTHPPLSKSAAVRLRRLGAFLFDPDGDFVLFDRVLH
jgi:hypothetical protein